MQFKHLYAFCAIVTIGLMAGCQSKVDLTNINKQAELDLNLAFPVGSLHLTVGDFLNDHDLANIYLDDSAVYHFIDTLYLPKKHYHLIDMSKYALDNEDHPDILVKPAIDNQTQIVGDGYTVTKLTFDLLLDAKGFNEDKDYERIDKIQVDSAKFYSYFHFRNFDVDLSEIKKVELELSNQFRCPDGQKITIPIQDYGFQETIPVQVDDLTISLMNDEDDPRKGTTDELNYRLHIYICPEDGHTIDVYDNSEIYYALTISMNHFKAAWGYFDASKDMKDENELDIDKEWDSWKNIKKLKVRFMEPMVDVYTTHKIAAPLNIHIDYLSAADAKGNKAYADWEGKQKMDSVLKKCLDPYLSNLDDSVTNKMHFGHGSKQGHIDTLFNVRPDFVRYSFNLNVDDNHPDFKWKQHRITPNDTIFGTAITDIPFKANENSEAEYVSTLTDVSISSISIDSIVASTDALDTIKTSEVKLIIQVDNYMPFNLDGYFTFLDKDSNELRLQLIEDSTKNHLYFPAPEMAIRQGETYGYVTKPSVTRQVISIGKNEFERLAEVKSIRLDVAMIGNPKPCKVTKQTDLRVRIGLAAKVDAILNFGGETENENTDKKK